MGLILGSKKKDDKVVLDVEMDYEEYLQLEGHMEDVHIVSANSELLKTNISERGKNSATKYFLIPRQLRGDFSFDEQVKVKRMDKDGQALFVYFVDKK